MQSEFKVSQESDRIILTMKKEKEKKKSPFKNAIVTFNFLQSSSSSSI